MASSSEDDDELVFLKCTDPHLTEPESNHSEIAISTAEISIWDLPTILSHQIIIVKADRIRLMEKSSYFNGLLGGNFSESCLKCISIQWNHEILTSILKVIFGCPVHITSDKFLPLFEGALFFGVETLLEKCKIWLTDVTSSKVLRSMQIQLDDLIQIWKFGLEHVNDFIPELCTSYLARNIMWAMSCNSFGDVPYDLLLSCVKHPHLTVDSERHLSDGLLVWISANREQWESLSNNKVDFTDILKQIRISLLPLWFAAGKRRCCYFADCANESIGAILSLTKHPSTSSVNVFGIGDLHYLKIRLTEYTKKVDLSGCPQMKPAIQLLSMLPRAYTTDPKLRKSIKKSSLNIDRLDRDQYHFSWGLQPTLSFEGVEEVDISNCPTLNLEAAIECFSKAFPLLRRLRAAYFLNFKTTQLRELVQKCPLLYDIDLTVDINPIIPEQVSIVSPCSATPKKSTVTIDALSSYISKVAVLSNIRRLSLEGRSDVRDSDLQIISKSCVSLCYLNLKGCTSVTDDGLSAIFLECMELDSIVACDTLFGQNSVLALCSIVPSCDHFDASQFEKKPSRTLAYKLQTLHMGGCKGVSETSLLELISQTQMLKSLCVRETQLVDNALYSLSGCSLEMLDVSDTKVSGTALAHIIERNPDLICLKARGCQNLFHQESKTEGEEFTSLSNSCKELFLKLGKTCKLEEIAFGWGFSYCYMEALKPAITSLRTITVGLGASLGEETLERLPMTCPHLEIVVLYFQVISDRIIISIVESLKHLQELALCYCFGEISSLSFNSTLPNLRKLKLERVTPWMSNDDLTILTQNCGNLIELSLLGCSLLNSDSMQIISSGWPGLISIHLEECGKLTMDGTASILDCKALEDLLLRHNGPGIRRNFIAEAASNLPMLRRVSLDWCDAKEGDYDIPDFADRYFLSYVKIARCKPQRCMLDLLKSEPRKTPVHKETLVLVWDSKTLTRTVVKERL